MNPERAKNLINSFAGKRLIVLGDLMLDEFIWGEVKRISPEAPVPVVEVKRESWETGGAGNVVSNLLEMDAVAFPIGIIGDDLAGAKLRQRLEQRGASTDFLVVDNTRPTTVKTRIVAHHQQMIRADRESKAPVTPEVASRIVTAFATALQMADAVIISDYDKGVLTPDVLAQVLTAAAGKIVCLDPKLKNFAAYKPVTVITPNQNEAEKATGIEIIDEASLCQAAQRIYEILGCPNVLITQGEHGMSLFATAAESTEKVTQIPTMAREVYDVTGAGDTVIATLALALAAGASMPEAARLANHAAGVVVGKLGTATLTRTELLQAISS